MRVRKLEYEDLTPEQKAVWDEIVAGPRGRVYGPHTIWLHRAKLLSVGQAVVLYCRYNSGLPARLSELAILVMSVFWSVGNEWHDHAPNALRLGVDRTALEALRTGKRPQFGKEDEQALFEFADELNRTHDISDATYQATVAVLGQDLVIDLVGVLGYYSWISMTIKAFRLPLPDGAADPLSQ